MAHVLVIQRNAHLAGEVRLEQVEGRDGPVARAQFTAISNVRWGSGESREEEATAILWTVWGIQADNAAKYLGKGSHVNVVGRVRNHTYDKDGQTIHGLNFSADEIDYLDSKARAAERRSRHEFVGQMNAAEAASKGTKS